MAEIEPRATKAYGSAVTRGNVKSFSTGWCIKEQLEHNVHLTFVHGDLSMRKVQNGAPSGMGKPSCSPHHARFHKPIAWLSQGEGTDILLLNHCMCEKCAIVFMRFPSLFLSVSLTECWSIMHLKLFFSSALRFSLLILAEQGEPSPGTWTTVGAGVGSPSPSPRAPPFRLKLQPQGRRQQPHLEACLQACWHLLLHSPQPTDIS